MGSSVELNWGKCRQSGMDGIPLVDEQVGRIATDCESESC